MGAKLYIRYLDDTFRDKPPWLWETGDETRARDPLVCLSVYILIDHLKIKNTGQH